jgi:hypothetical protein
MAARADKRATLARPDTAIVIEGFPRSGNTFAVAAFAVANGEDLPVGRHLHGAPHLLRAARLGLPAVVLIRRPADAVSSYLVRRPTLTGYDAVVEYLDFYRTAQVVLDRLVVGLFDQVITDFGVVIGAVNDRFGTSFARYLPTPANRAAAFALVERLNRLECRGQVVETHVGRPSAARAQANHAVRQQLARPHVSRLLTRAEALYDEYAACALTAGHMPAAGTRPATGDGFGESLNKGPNPA